MDKKFLSELKNSGGEYRGAPFWAWNGRLEPAELRRQVRIMRRMGLGGFFIHSRQCLSTAYLSKEWMDCVSASVDEAARCGMNVWLYDEDRWPSGAAGGLVTKDPRFRMWNLEMSQYVRPGDFRWDKTVMAAFLATGKGPNLTGFTRLRKGSRPARLGPDQRILAFRAAQHKPESWYNGGTYLDTMNPQAVRQFIRVTHEAYARRFRGQFGKVIPGIFTDEPNNGIRSPRLFGRDSKKPVDILPWTPRLPREFRRRYGYNLLDHLPELFFAVGGRVVSPIRWNYHDCITALFVEAFSRQIGRWCERHNLLHTGHVLAEANLLSQTLHVGSAMRFYEYMHAPGMDLLNEIAREYDTAKQVSSMARQFGRRWRLSETYGCTGWQFPFAGHKALGDWQAALGVNLRCQHLSWYTMEGEAKRDYPASIFFQSPWWQSYAKVEDYFARVNVLMSRGREVRDLLVIHPIESMWNLLYIGCDQKTREKFDEKFWVLRDSLLAEHIDFDYGDEEVMSRHARVVRKAGQAVLKVGQALYRAVIVPPMLTMRSSTLALLRKFAAAGGKVVFAGGPADYVDAEPSEEVRKLALLCTRSPRRGAELAKTVEKEARGVSIADSSGKEIRPALYCLREDATAFYLFVCNTSMDVMETSLDGPPVRKRTAAFDDVRIAVRTVGEAQPLEVDCETGEIYSADAKGTADGWSIRTHLPALGSKAFILPKKRTDKTYPRRPVMKDVRMQTLGGRWDIQLSEPNCLVLDRPRYRINSGPWQGPMEILQVDTAVREAIGIPPLAWNMVQPWARPIKSEKQAEVELEYAFEVKTLPAGPINLAIERPETFRVFINGQFVDGDVECGWWVDCSLRLLPIDPAVLHLGVNKLIAVCDFRDGHSGLEIVYLLGEFGTAVSGTDVAVTAAPRTLAIGDWTRQGLAFYGGNVSFRRWIKPAIRKGQRLFVQVPSYEGVGLRVLIDGKAAGVIGWPPNEVDVTDFIQPAGSMLTIEVLGHRRNSHGPLHLAEQPRGIWPASWRAKGELWFDGYKLVPCGLTSKPALVTRK